MATSPNHLPESAGAPLLQRSRSANLLSRRNQCAPRLLRQDEVRLSVGQFAQDATRLRRADALQNLDDALPGASRHVGCVIRGSEKTTSMRRHFQVEARRSQDACRSSGSAWLASTSARAALARCRSAKSSLPRSWSRRPRRACKARSSASRVRTCSVRKANAVSPSADSAATARLRPSGRSPVGPAKGGRGACPLAAPARWRSPSPTGG